MFQGLLDGVGVIKFPNRSKIQVLFDGFDALVGNFTQVCALWKESPNDLNAVFHRSLVLGGIGAGKIGIGLEDLDNPLVRGKGLVIVKRQSFDEGRRKRTVSGSEQSMWVVFRATECFVRPDGQLLVVPEITVDAYWTSMD